MEMDLQNLIRLDHGMNPDLKLFRNNVGEAWQGEVIARDKQSVTLNNPRRVVYGLAPGTADLIGIRRRLIRPDDVGTMFGQFVSAETKPGKRAPQHQIDWRDFVRLMGGMAEILHSRDQATEFFST